MLYLGEAFKTVSGGIVALWHSVHVPWFESSVAYTACICMGVLFALQHSLRCQ